LIFSRLIPPVGINGICGSALVNTKEEITDACLLQLTSVAGKFVQAVAKKVNP